MRIGSNMNKKYRMYAGAIKRKPAAVSLPRDDESFARTVDRASPDGARLLKRFAILSFTFEWALHSRAKSNPALLKQKEDRDKISIF
jgi:hypothetical protein